MNSNTPNYYIVGNTIQYSHFGQSARTKRFRYTRSGMTFSKVQHKNGEPTRIIHFFNYIREQQANGRLATRKGFLKYMGKPVTPGYWSDFFAGVVRTGAIVKRTTDTGTAVYILPNSSR